MQTLIPQYQAPYKHISKRRTLRQGHKLQIQLHTVTNLIVRQRDMISKRSFALPHELDPRHIASNHSRDELLEIPCRYLSISPSHVTKEK